MTNFIYKLKDLELQSDEEKLCFVWMLSVPRDEAKQAVNLAPEERDDTNTHRDAIMNMMDFVMNNNCFTFNNKKNYLQIG